MQEEIEPSDGLLVLTFDASEAMTQGAQLSESLLRLFPEGVPNDLVENIRRLLSDVVLCDGGTTTGTDGIGKRLIRLRFGDGYENVMTALRTGKISDLVHAANNTTA